APGAEDDVGGAADDLVVVGEDALLGQRLGGEFREDVVAAGDADQFGDPADAADAWLVPFLEVDPGSPRKQRRLSGNPVDTPLQLPGISLGLCGTTDQRTEPAHVVEDL